MAAYQSFNDFSEQLARGVHNITTDVYKVMLTNVAPVAANTVKTDLTEIAAGSGYTAGGTVTTLSLVEVSGTTTVSATQVVFTAAGGAMASGRYFVLYNDSATNKNLVCFHDYGSSFVLADGESITWKPSNTSPGAIFSLA